MSQIGRRFGLSDQRGSGVSCDEKGVFVGAVSLVELCHRGKGLEQWRPRPAADLNRDLSKRYGLPIEFDAKLVGLAAVARALGRGDIVHAQIATLHLRIPDPPALVKAAPTVDEVIALAPELRASGLLKADWDPSQHPRWPAGSPGGIGGEFAPAGSDADNSLAGEMGIEVTPAELTIPMPFELPGIPFPSEIVPAPLIPNVNPRDLPRNPFPDRPECEEEWTQARAYCDDLEKRGLLGVGDYRGMGRTFRDCVMGQVSADCGGNPTA